MFKLIKKAITYFQSSVHIGLPYFEIALERHPPPPPLLTNNMILVLIVHVTNSYSYK